MPQINVTDKIKNKINLFVERLKEAYSQDLVSIIIYGSAASGEFVNNHSNINFLVVIKSNDLSELKKITRLINKFPLFQPLLLTEDYIKRSIDVFPIEFLDLRENYILFYGEDVLRNIQVDERNLRFQCEYELKSKLIGLRQLYLQSSNDPAVLYLTLLKAFTSVLHLSRNILRLMGRRVPYKKDEILNELSLALSIDISVWSIILAAKNRQVKITRGQREELFLKFIAELEKVIEAADKL